MGTEKRARQKAGRQARIEAAVVAQQRAQNRARIIRIGLIVVVVLAVLGGVAFLNRSSDQTVATGAGSTSTTLGNPDASIVDRNGQTVPPDPNSTIPVATPAGATITGDTPCPPADGSAQRTTKFEKAPTLCIDTAKKYTALVKTTKGDFTIALDASTAPTAVNNFVTLSRYHFYDGTNFHRVIPGFVVQGGDATGNPPGTGGPGYKFADELPKDKTVYQPRTVAMANSGPDTNGSQFYIVLQPDKLEAKYSVFGQVTDGFDTTVAAIEKGGSESGTPVDPTSITSVTITES